jgi:predicted permease
MRRSRLPSGIVGATITVLVLFLILVFGSRFFPNPAPEGVLLVGPAHQLCVAASVLVPVAYLLLACFAGGLAAGRLVPDSPGANGALGPTLGFLGGFVWFVWSLVPWVFVKPSNPGEVFTRSDNVGTLIFLTAAFCTALPFVALGGFFGGRLGGRPRRGVRAGGHA